jgi:SAM-dependent methyltransferase
MVEREMGFRPQDWAGMAEVFALIFTLWSTVRRRWRAVVVGAVATIAADLTSRAVSKRHPAPFRARFRFALVHSRRDRQRLLAALAPKPGERILELGPGVGQHAVDVARALAPLGALDVLDLQSEMLAAVAERARAHGIENINARTGDACARLPYGDATFDAAYLSSVLGELPDPDGALRELQRVLKPGGCLVVAETFFDPDYVSLRTMQRRANGAGFKLEARRGSPIGYAARLQTITPT